MAAIIIVVLSGIKWVKRDAGRHFLPGEEE